jgi:hypothetical protein
MIVGSSTFIFGQRGPKSKEGIGGRGAISARREEIICRRKQKKERISERVENNSAFKESSSSDETQTYHMRQLME